MTMHSMVDSFLIKSLRSLWSVWSVVQMAAAFVVYSFLAFYDNWTSLLEEDIDSSNIDHQEQITDIWASDSFVIPQVGA